jgi:small subunit ribosomal protein S20
MNYPCFPYEYNLSLKHIKTKSFSIDKPRFFFIFTLQNCKGGNLPARRVKVHKDVIKRLRTSLKARERNREIKSQLKNLVKKVETKPDTENLRNAFSLLDKASRKKIIPKNTASRIKSRISRILNKATKPGAGSKAEA